MKNIFPHAQRFKRLADMSHDKWLAARKEGIGGSDAAAILGMSEWSSAFDVWLDKTGRAEEKPDNLNMMIGRELEETVARLWASETGKKVTRCGFMLQNEEKSWLLADVDRMVTGENAGLECKTTSSLSNIRKLKGGDFPDAYYAQCVHYMAVTGADRWYLAVLELGIAKNFRTFVIERDESEIEALVNAEQEFWEGCVKRGSVPVPSGTDQTDEYIRSEYPVAKDESETVGLYGSEDDLAGYLAKKAEAKALDKEITALEQRFKLALGDASKGKAQGFTVSFTNATRSGGVDAKKLETDYPEAFAACRKPDTTYRRFTVKEEK